MSQVVTDNLRIAINKLAALELSKCFNAFDRDSRPTPKQEEVLRDCATVSSRFVIAGNQSGKSQLGAREVSWVFTHSHPYWNTKAQFGDIPLLILVIGRVGEQVETELWSRKIKPFLDESCYKEVRTGNTLQRVVHKENGNTIVFLSHHNVNEAREKAQSFTAAYVWLDEMPRSLSLVMELELRTVANNGRMLTTFTPLLRDPKIKNKVENCKAPVGKKYQFGMLDNPIYQGREDEIRERFKDIPEDERNARMYGDWFKGGQQVYEYDPTKHNHNPDNYHPSWPHIEVVDPAASGKAGYVLLANRPGNAGWYVVKAMYLKGAAASDLLDEIEKHSQGYNIIRKVSDPHEAWFIKEAAKRKRYYSGVYKKNERKYELIKNLVTAIKEYSIIITDWVPDVEEELNTCMWAEESENKIVGASRFHLLDCLQYGVDNLPKVKEIPQATTWEHELKQANRKRLEKKAKMIGKLAKRRSRSWM